MKHAVDCWDFSGLTRITASDKKLRNKAFNIPKNLKYDGYQRGFCFKGKGVLFLIKKPSTTCAQPETLATQNKFSGSGTKNENMSDQ